MSKVISPAEALNIAFQLDPNAIHALVVNRVPCNRFLADDQFVQVDGVPVLGKEYYQVGSLGLINAVLAAQGLPLVAAKWSEEVDGDGRHKLDGFCEFKVKA